eukprot:m.71242 g.71242  ORF g.71242 m.71242 type:complete len:277 (+) comp12227_c0_seq2:49-879(+)
MSGSADPEKLSPEEEQRKEEEHYRKVIRAFLFYRQHALERIDRAQRSYFSQTLEYQSMLPFMPEKHAALRRAVEVNAQLVGEITSDGLMFATAGLDEAANPNPSPERPAEFDMDKVYTTIKQFVRDWSLEGKEERERCYQPILDEIDSRFGKMSRQDVSIVVPGAGLGRLAWECAHRGYRCQGNEWSVFMLLASNYILNRQSGRLHTIIHPYAHQYCNNYHTNHQSRAVRIPDVDTFDIPGENLFSMAAGDFLEVYSTPEKWDCVASCFFWTQHEI